jgi:hypothetical protein
MAYSILILSKKNNIFFSPEAKMIYKKTRPSIKFFLYKIYIKTFYNLDCAVVLNIVKSEILIYSNIFFKKINAQDIKKKINLTYLKQFVKKNYKNNHKILLLSSYDSLIIEKLIDYTYFKNWINKLMKTNYFNNILFKRKDFTEKKYEAEKKLPEDLCMLPGNLMIYSHKIVIGYYSALLYEAANAGCVSISLLDLLAKDIRNLKDAKGYMTRNLQKNKKILYPKTFEQFIEYCK